MTQHGYVAYSNGCRCSVCRKAKAEYMRERRRANRDALAAAFGDPPRRHEVVGGGTHGRAGYDERRCRCDVCRSAKKLTGGWR